MVTKKESIRIEYKPLSTSESVSTITGNKRQTYDVNTGYFQPDRRLDPLQVLVTCNIYDAHKLVEGVVNESLTDVMWKVTDATGKLVVIQNTDKQFRIGQGADKGMITIFKNIPDLEETTIEFTARYMEPKSKRVTNFQTTFSLITVTEAVAQNQLQLTAPVGTVQFPFVNNKGLVLQADLMRAGKKVPAAYWWSKDGKEIANEAQDKLVVTSLNKVGGVYQVEVADCSMKFNELVSEKVEADKEVIEWRRFYENETKNILEYKNILYGVIDGDNFFSRKNISTLTASCWAKTILDETWVKSNIKAGARYKTTYTIKVISKPGGNYSNQAFMQLLLFNRLKTGERYVFASIKEDVYGNLKTGDIIRIEGSSYVPLDISNFVFLFYTSSHTVQGKSLRSEIEIIDFKIEEFNVTDTIWSPSKVDLEDLIFEKTDFYASQTTLPLNYRPTPKPSVLLKKEMFLKRSLGDYDVEILYPKVVDADADSVRFEAVFTNNRGSIPDSSKYFDVGWWKKADGSFEYKGLIINVPMAKLQILIAAGKGVEYTITEK